MEEFCQRTPGQSVSTASQELQAERVRHQVDRAYYKKVDEYGNSFRWGAPLNIKASEARDGRPRTTHAFQLRRLTKRRSSYDVWLVNSDAGK